MSASSATPSPQLIIPFAACSGDYWLAAVKSLPAGSLKNLGALLQGMKLVETSQGEALSLSTPHERILAKALGLNDKVDGLIAWAALQASGQGLGAGKAWAFMTPCHWSMGREHATMTDPAALGLSEEDSKTLLAAMQPYFETEGVTLHYLEPGRWLAEGELFRTLPTASLDRVLGRNVDLWLPGTDTAASLRRLQNEMQMLLYTHEVNEARAENRLQPVNSFWLSGTGALQNDTQEQPAGITMPRTLAQAAFNDDWAAYLKAWEGIDAGEVARFLALQHAGTAVRLSLCGESNAQTFETSAPGFFNRISNAFSQPKPLDVLVQL